MSSWQQSIQVRQETEWRWRIPRQGPMRTDGVVFADAALMESLRGEGALEQVANVACLPGIVGPSMGMPDIHWGYGFPIGGVAAFDLDDGVVSPGGVGYDINCGVRLLRSDLELRDLEGKAETLVQGLFSAIPCGVGRARQDLRLSRQDFARLAVRGARWAVESGFGDAGDVDRIEEGGCLPGAVWDRIGPRAAQRGQSQLGTLGSGNHFVEVGHVDAVYDEAVAERVGLRQGGITVIIHTGSRGFGYQVCEDHLRELQKAVHRHGISIPDRQLCCAPLGSEEGRAYLEAMACAANYAFANRQVITHHVRRTFESILQLAPRDHGLRVVYDVCHNIAKIEDHAIDGKRRKVCVHRKGATRAFPAGHPEVPEAYRDVGQPVLVPGDMGRYSYVLVGSPESPDFTCASCCHGAGRRLSRKKALRATRDRQIARELRSRGIHIAAASRRTIDEEFPDAYKDVAHVVDVVEHAGLAIPVARLRPLAVVKG